MVVRSTRPGAIPAEGTWSRRAVLARRLLGQTLLVSLAALAYFGVRGLTQGSAGLAFENARRVLGSERALGVAWERGLQDAVLDRSWLVTALNWVYIYGHWPVVIAALLWLFVRHPPDYLALRDAMFISGAIGLVIFMAFPTAPPRLVDLGLVDTVTQRSSSYRALQPPGLLNKYAAMPSLHFGWNLLVGIALVRVARRRAVQAVVIAVPIAMAIAVVATANHFVLDVPAGAVVALAGRALVPVLRRVQGAVAARRSR